MVLLAGFVLVCCGQSLRDKAFEAAVHAAVDKQMKTYPKSTLKDLYKHFFQDKFGPGHIVSDTTGAGNYLRSELASSEVFEGEVAESTGWEGNFYRVNLSVIKNQQITYEQYFDAFIRSVSDIRPPAIDVWKQEWRRIERIIRSKELNLPDYDADRLAIEQSLEAGEFMGHHSPAFEEAYAPHYRIISKEIYEKELLPLL
jgi:hypothetical protein